MERLHYICQLNLTLMLPNIQIHWFTGNHT